MRATAVVFLALAVIRGVQVAFTQGVISTEQWVKHYGISNRYLQALVYLEGSTYGLIEGAHRLASH